MTEDEAKTKWCPFYQVATSGGDTSTFETDNRPPEHELRENVWHPTGKVHEQCRCIGSACMAWRWEMEYVTIEGTNKFELSKVNGHCGLAGKP